MSVIKAFVIAHGIAPVPLKRVHAHCADLASRHGAAFSKRECHGFVLLLVTATEEPAADPEASSFDIGGVGCHPVEWDRFVRFSIDPEGVSVENDYAGSIPVFYSNRAGFVASNIEPCVYLATDSTLDDLSPENLYGFLRYSHFIWDETAWKHIHQMLPDSRYQFTANGTLRSTTYLRTVRATQSRTELSDELIADELYDLNRSLVVRALGDADEIILPLSSGYDSRLIYSVLANDPNLSARTRCFTYGPAGSIEVESGRRLCELKDVDWHHVNLPCGFLTREYLQNISNIFGASLHMHGMYQLEFFEQLRRLFGVVPSARLTSGFMTGVPAGQHTSVLQLADSERSLTNAMNRFSQSQDWVDDDLEKMPIFSGKRYLEKAEERFRLAFDRFDGEIHQKTIMLDVWTRQRNFISYYPRTLEWLATVVSPHMCAEYANFFLSLDRRHLANRKAVEMLFVRHYPDIARVASNSNGVGALGSRFVTGIFMASRIFNRLGLPNLLPRRFHNTPIEFDLTALRNCGKEAFYPLLADMPEIHRFAEMFGGQDLFRILFRSALGGDARAYARIVTLQAVAITGLLGLPQGIDNP